MAKRWPEEARLISRPPCADKRRNPVDQDKVAQVIGAELRLEAVGRMPKRRGHHARVGDDDIEGFALRQQSIGAGAHALETGEIERNQLEASAVRRSVCSHLGGRRFGLGQVARRAHYLCAMCGE